MCVLGCVCACVRVYVCVCMRQCVLVSVYVCVCVWEGAHEDKMKNRSKEISLTFESVIVHKK